MTLVRTACPTCGRVQSIEASEFAKSEKVTRTCRCGTTFETTKPEGLKLPAAVEEEGEDAEGAEEPTGEGAKKPAKRKK